MKKLALVLGLAGVSIFNSSFSQNTAVYAGLTVQYGTGSFKFNDKSNDPSKIESGIVDLLIKEYPNVKESSNFEDVFSTYVNVKGHPTFDDIKEKEFPTEITSILFPKESFSDSQIARESVIILNELIGKGDYGLSNGEYRSYRVKSLNDGDDIKIVIMINGDK